MRNTTCIDVVVGGFEYRSLLSLSVFVNFQRVPYFDAGVALTCLSAIIVNEMNGPPETPPPARAINEVEESSFGVLLRGFVTSRSGMLIFEVSVRSVRALNHCFLHRLWSALRGM